MSGEAIVVWGAQKVLESNGGVINNTGLLPASVPYDVTADGGGYPDARFVLTASWANAPQASTPTIVLVARELDVDGTLDVEVPVFGRLGNVVGRFNVIPRNGQQTLVLIVNDVPAKAEYYVVNLNTGQAIAAGWTLKVTPKSYKAAP